MAKIIQLHVERAKRGIFPTTVTKEDHFEMIEALTKQQKKREKLSIVQIYQHKLKLINC